MPSTIQLIALAVLALVPVLNAGPASEYSVDAVARVVMELQRPEYEKPVKEWLKVQRPAQYQALFEEKTEEPDADKSGPAHMGILTALGELNAAIADFETLLLDYYINYKAAEGWEVVSLSDKMILFRRDREQNGEQERKVQPAARSNSK